MTRLTRTTPWAFRLLGPPPIIYVSVCFVFGIIFMRSLGISNSAVSTCLSGSQPDLSPEDNVTALALAQCSPCPYAADQVGYSWPFEFEVSSLCCFEAFASFHHESLSHRALCFQAHQGRASGSGGDAVSEAPEHETENPGLR